MAGIQIDGVNNKIDFDDDADTSISSASDDTLVIESGGVNIASITAGEFAINEGSANIDFRVESNGNTHMLFVDGGNDFVGIGTSSPEQPLHIKSTAGVRMERFQAGSGGANIDIRKSRNATVGSHTVLQDGDAIGGLTFRGSDGTEYENAAAILCFVDGTPGTDDMPGMLSFRTTADGANSYTERMRLTSAGKLEFSMSTFGSSVSASVTGFEIHKNTNSPFIQHGVAGTGTATMYNFINGNGVVGKISVNGSATTYATSSDYRLKENVNYDFDATSRLKQLKPSRFNFIADADTTVDGFLAHEVSDIVPEAITGEKDETETYTDDDGQQQTRPVYQGIDQSKLVPLMVKTIQELEARIKILEGN